MLLLLPLVIARLLEVTARGHWRVLVNVDVDRVSRSDHTPGRDVTQRFVKLVWRLRLDVFGIDNTGEAVLACETAPCHHVLALPHNFSAVSEEIGVFAVVDKAHRRLMLSAMAFVLFNSCIAVIGSLLFVIPGLFVLIVNLFNAHAGKLAFQLCVRVLDPLFTLAVDLVVAFHLRAF